MNQVLEDWWDTAQRSMTVADEKSFKAGPSKEGEEGEVQLHHDKYVLLSRKIYKAMVAVWDEQEADEAAEDDWMRDSREGKGLTKTLFMDAMFELADVYTDSIDGEEYAHSDVTPPRSHHRTHTITHPRSRPGGAAHCPSPALPAASALPPCPRPTYAPPDAAQVRRVPSHPLQACGGGRAARALLLEVGRGH